jgi:hypothetical protein
MTCGRQLPLAGQVGARSGPEGERNQPCEARDRDGGQVLLARGHPIRRKLRGGGGAGVIAEVPPSRRSSRRR